MNEETQKERCCVCNSTDIFRCGVYYKDPVVCRGCDRIVFDHFNYDEGKPLSKKQIRQCKRFRLKRVLQRVLKKVLEGVLLYAQGMFILFIGPLFFGVLLGPFAIGVGLWQVLIEKETGACSVAGNSGGLPPHWTEPVGIGIVYTIMGMPIAWALVEKYNLFG